MKIDAYFFDLDGTLYKEETGLFDEINRRIDIWIHRTAAVPESESKAVRARLFDTYGGTLPGLTIEYGSDYYASLRFCHDIRTDDYLSPNPKLCAALKELPGRKYIFTSSYRFYANRVLDSLGIRSCFDGIIDAVDVYPYLKPSPQSFRRALEITAETDVSRCAFLDDHPRNVAAGHREGFFAVQVGSHHPRTENADAYLDAAEDILTIPEFHMEG